MLLQNRSKQIGWGVLAVFIVLMTGVTLLTALNLLANQKQLPSISFVYIYYSVLTIHITLATVAVLAGILQFTPSIRNNHIEIHRITGRIYVGCVFVSGVSALFVALFTERFDEQVAFLTLDVLWLLTIWKAFRAIRQKQVDQHRLWMVRNYALTLAAIFARAVVPLMVLVQIVKSGPPAGGFATLLNETLGTGVWLTIVFNLVIADWLVNRSQKLKSGLLSWTGDTGEERYEHL